MPKSLRVFLCHGPKDKGLIQKLNRRLSADGMDCWLDDEKILPGQDRDTEIHKAIRWADVVVIGLSKKAITKEGYLHREIRQALDVAVEKPEDAIYLIPAQFEECSIPDRLKDKQWVNLYDANGYGQLISALYSRAQTLHRAMRENIPVKPFFDEAAETTEQTTVDKPAGLRRKGAAVRGEDAPPSPGLLFVNRVDEIDAITATASAEGQYFLVEAPAGYGKTALLGKLDERFKAKGNWLHAFVSVKNDCSLETLTRVLAQKLDLVLNSDSDLDWGYRFSGALKKRYHGSSVPAGVALLIDLDGRPSIDLFKQLTGKFIPQVWENLADLDAFSSSTSPSLFRVIISGRNVAASEELKYYRERLPFITRSLSPFTYDVICQSVRKYLPALERGKSDQLAAHVLFLTGGHPRCMTSALEIFKSKAIPVDRFVADHGENIWKQTVRDTAEEVWKEVPGMNGGFQETFNRLSVFRYVNNYVLRHVMGKCAVADMRDEIDLRDRLTASYLYTSDGRFLQDDIIRRLIVIRLRHLSPDVYEDYCKDAYKVCRDQLKDPNVQLPEKWVIELLNQFLQKFAGNGIGKAAERAKTAGLFYKEAEQILQIRRKCKESLADWREEIEVLLTELEKNAQWEFRFCVNYFLRENQYNDEPFQQLKRNVKNLYRSK